jgi:RNA polymerase sigma factor (sigma-70 family)
MGPGSTGQGENRSLKTADVTATSTISPDATDDRLVAAAKAGSPEAFAALFQRYRREIARYAGRTIGDDGRAEDVVQEVFISALRGIRTLDRPAGFKAWLYRIAHNACIDHMRRRGKAEEVSFDAHGLPPAEEIRLFRQLPSSHAALTQKENFTNLRQALMDMPASQAEILVLRELEGLTYDEIAVRMNISRSAVESMLFRARRALRIEFGEISTGERCVRMRSVMAQIAEGVGGRGDRRRLVRHVTGCQACRRDAFMMGLGPTLAGERRGVRGGLSRVAALLPLPGFLNRRPEETGRISSETGQLTSSSGTVGTSLASHAQAAITHVTVTAGASVEHAATAIQKAAAVVAAAAVVSGGGLVAKEARTDPPVPPPTAAKRVAGAPSPGSVPARPGAVFTSPMPLSLAPLAAAPAAVILPIAPAQSTAAEPSASPAQPVPATEAPAAAPPATESAAPAEETFDTSAATSPDPAPVVETVTEVVTEVPAEVPPAVEPAPQVEEPVIVVPDEQPDSGGSPPVDGGTADDTGGSGSFDTSGS